MSVRQIQSLTDLSGVALDLGGTKTAVARIDRGEVTAYHVVPTCRDHSASALVREWQELTARVDLEFDQHLAVAVTGRIDQAGNWYAVNRHTLSEVSQVPLQNLLTRTFARNVAIVNDAVAGGIAEQYLGAGAGSARMAYLTISTGVGAGILLDGQPLISPTGMAGHVGFASSRFSTRACGSGRSKTVESVASGSAIALAAEEDGRCGYSAKDVFTAHMQGEPWATEIIRLSARAIAELAADLVAILGIERIVIGGSVGLAKGYIELVEQALLTVPELFRPRIVSAQLGANSVLLGALLHQLNFVE